MLLVLAPSATAAKAPANFFGVTPVTLLSPAEMQLAKSGGVSIVRPHFAWNAVEPAEGQFDFTQTDEVVRNAANAGVELAPLLFQAPSWATGCYDDRHCLYYAPVGDPTLEARWATYLKALVDRYGPNGAFWADPANASVPNQPIRTWIVWNEENGGGYFQPDGASPARYAKLLKASAQAIRSKDPGAQLVLGGLAGGSNVNRNKGSMPADKFLAALYKQSGARNNFDAVALHPYSATIPNLKQEIVTDRAVIQKNGDGSTPIWLTEVGWASNHTTSSLSKGLDGQAELLKKSFRLVLKNRKAWNIARLFWFTWRDVGNTPCLWCGDAGLFTKQLDPKPAWRAYKSLAAR